MSGSREALELFAVDPTTGEVTVKSDLSADTQLSYTVSVTNINNTINNTKVTSVLTLSCHIQ